MSMNEKKRNFLSIHLTARGGHLGRSNEEMQRIADLAGLSVHTVQSYAMGRRPMSDAAKAKVRDAIAKSKAG